MAYTYLSLTNDVCRRMGEVVLDSSTFAGATGVQAHIKDSVNYAIRDINQFEYEWPFNAHTQTDTLVAGTSRYSFPADLKTLSMDSFRIQQDDTLGNDTRHLSEITYEHYLRKFVDQEYSTSTTVRGLPEYVAKTPDLGYVLAKTPDKAYSLTYEYFKIPDDLVSATEVPTIPESFRRTIIDGACYYMYMFKGDTDNTQITGQKFQQDLKQLRSLYINRYSKASSTMIIRDNRYNAVEF